MPDQHEPGGKKRALDQRNLADVLAYRILLVDAVGDHLAIGDATHAGLIEGTGGALVEVHAAMPQAVGAHRVVAAPGLGQAGQVC